MEWNVDGPSALHLSVGIFVRTSKVLVNSAFSVLMTLLNEIYCNMMIN